MKIAIVSNDGKAISKHFGSSRGFVVVEVADGKEINREYRPNQHTDHARGVEHEPGEHGHHGPILAALADVEVVIGGGMGYRIITDLEQTGKQIFITDEITVNGALNLYLQGKLVHLAGRTCMGGSCH
jgi:predicted Fe-Mo cluster-binding NifX family protein